MKKAKFNENVADGLAVRRALLGSVLKGGKGPSLGIENLLSAGRHRALEERALVGEDRSAETPGLVGSESAFAEGSSGGVGFGQRGLEVIVGPVTGMAVPRGVLFGSTCQRADARFDGAIVTRRARG